MSAFKYPTLSTSIAVSDAARAIAFYQTAFDAKERCRLINPGNGRIGHAEILIGDIPLMLSDDTSALQRTPATLGGVTARLALHCKNVDAAFHQAIAAGAEKIRLPADQFYGHRCACIRDPFGHEWMLFQEIETLSPAEMQHRWNTMPPSSGASAH